MPAPIHDLILIKGKTFKESMLYGEDQKIYKPITALVSQAPVQITCPAHGVPLNWACRVESALSPLGLNTPEGSWVIPRIVDNDTLEINNLNLLHAEAFSGPAVLIYQKPADITGWVFRAQIRDKVGGQVLATFSSNPADASEFLITVDAVNSSFTLHISAVDTENLTWSRGVYDVEALLPDGTVLAIVSPSKVSVEREVTVWA